MAKQTDSLAIEEQIDIDSYELMQNLRLVRGINKEEREKILSRVNEDIHPYIASQIPDLVMEVCSRGYLAYHFKEVGIDYVNMQREDSRLIRIAITKHLLEKQDS